ncbi:MAG: hypothetical protein DME48_04735 [Verrucomicrobia bacterium]|nr:MAG: hypothetical protein DME48_04735 [Verrucomicrobiota bacterium]
MAAAADNRVTAPTIRRCETKRLLVNQRGVFIYFFEAEVPATRSGGSSNFAVQGNLACLNGEKEVKTFYIKLL